MKRLILLFLVVFAFGENFLNLKLTNKTVEVSGQYIIIPQNNIYARATYLYNDDKDNFYSVGLKGEGNLIGSDIDNLKFSLLMDFVYVKDYSALPIGVGINYMLNQFNLPIFVRAEAEYAPEVLSFNKAEKFSKFFVEIATQPITNGEMFVGYRHISFTNTYNAGFYVGVGFVF